jgi:hypothetical protein
VEVKVHVLYVFVALPPLPHSQLSNTLARHDYSCGVSSILSGFGILRCRSISDRKEKEVHWVIGLLVQPQIKALLNLQVIERKVHKIILGELASSPQSLNERSNQNFVSEVHCNGTISTKRKRERERESECE